VTPALEIFVIRTGPDGLTRITARCLGEGTPRTWVVPAPKRRIQFSTTGAELHDRVLGYPAVVVS